MRPQSTGIVELHDSKQKERGFGCMKLIAFLTEDGVTEWEQWHGAHTYRQQPDNARTQESVPFMQGASKRH